MSINQNNLSVNDEPMGRDDADLLISRAVDGRTSASDWAMLETAAVQDPGVWRRLAQAHRDQALLVKSVGRVVDTAEHVELPSRVEAEQHAQDAPPSRLHSFRSWGGWAAAAVLLFAVIVQTNRIGSFQAPDQSVGTTGTNMAGPAGLATAAEAFNTYLNKGKEEGRVLGEVPDQVLVDSRPAPNGEGFDVVYVRQVVERARVQDLYRFSRDEAGRVTPVRVRAAAPQDLPKVY